MNDKLFAHIALPVRPEAAVDGAIIHFAEVAEEPEALGVPFFGGYAEDFLAGLGMDMMDVAPEAVAPKIKRIQG